MRERDSERDRERQRERQRQRQRERQRQRQRQRDRQRASSDAGRRMMKEISVRDETFGKPCPCGSKCLSSSSKVLLT